MRNCRGIYFTITPSTLSPITSTLGGGNSGTAASTEYIRVYLSITIFTHINIVYKRVTNIAKNI